MATGNIYSWNSKVVTTVREFDKKGRLVRETITEETRPNSNYTYGSTSGDIKYG